jgi:polyisoprenoid-binding protein YceI
MKKMVRILGMIAFVAGCAIVLTQCNKDETKYGTLSGTITLEGTSADGAIVTLSSGANGSNVVARVVADASGMYSIMGIEAGTYYLNATWEPSNNNNLLKSTNTVILTGVETEVSVDGDKTQDITLAGAVSGGDVVFDAADWTWDNTHSTIEFEFPYDAFNAVFTGHFANVGFDELYFDETNPENTSIKAWVDVTSVETGAASPPCEHGRDGITGCISGTFGVELDPADTVNAYCTDGSMVTNWPNEEWVEYDLWGDGSQSTYMRQHAVVGSTGVATFESSSVTAYGTGYLAKGILSFAGAEAEVNLYFNYIEGYEGQDRNQNTVKYVSFFGWFKMAAASDFGIVSGHVGDSDVTVKVSAQFNKAL